MADNVIRRDVIKLDLESDALEEIKRLRKELDDLKKKISGGVGEEEFDKTGRKVKGAREEIDKTTKSAGKLGTALKSAAKVSFKALVAGIGAASTAVGVVVKQSVSAYAELEQLEGGAKKIFDEADMSGIMKDANNAYKELGLSANDYLRTINDVGANLASTMGDQKGYEAAKTGLQAISDYASGTGKNVDELSEKFTMITRSTSTYQSIADQFAGILPTTSKDFLSQAQSAGLLAKKYKKLTDVPMAEYQGAVAEMLKLGVENLGLAGNTADEAESTISGSLAMVKAAWQNMLPALIEGGDQFDQCLENLVDSAGAFGKMIIPALKKSLSGVGKLVEELAPVIEKELPGLVEDLLPPLIKAGTSLLKSFIVSLPVIVKAVIAELPNILKEVGTAIGEAFGIELPGLKKLGNFISENGDKIKKFTPILAGLAGALILFPKIKAIGGAFSGLFGGGKGEKGGLFSGIAELGKTNTGLVLKGMANLTIIIGGFTALGAAFALAAPYIAELSDLKSLGEVALIVTGLGLIGAVLTKFAQVAGKIPVSVVAKGLANMAIMIGGMTAIGAVFAWVAPYIAKLSDTKSLLKLAAIITVLGVVGTVLSVFAGIAGLIPFPVVLAGLGNIALVLGGFTAIVEAFGLLSQIPGFTEFLDKGGQVLVKLCDILGEMVGSLIGGALESVSNVLPAIGANIAAFATNLRPVFTMFQGVDVAGIGSFFSAIGSFMLKMAGEKILSFFSGGPDFASIATGLGQLSGPGVRNFLRMVTSFDEIAYTNAEKFFNALDGISKLPNVGGIGQLFSGENDYSGVATGLGILSGTGVRTFFRMVSGFEETAFTNGEKFFKALDGISKLPNVGGIGQVFSGTNDFEGVAEGLAALSGAGVRNFFRMVTGLDESVFGKTKQLFTTLAGINDVGKEGFWDKVGNLFGGGDKSSPLSTMASGLSDFATKASDFFALVNDLRVYNLNALFNALTDLTDATSDLSGTVSNEFEKIVNVIKKKCSEAIKCLTTTLKQIRTDITTTNLSPAGITMMNSFISGINSRRTAVINAISSITSDINKKINSVIKGGNWTLEQFGSDKRLAAYEYARGTGGHPGGNAVVNDGRGAELVQMPNGNTFLARGRNVFLPNAPRGMKVLDAMKTARLFGRKSPTFNYADGTGDIDVLSYDKGSSLVNAVAKKFVDFSNSSGYALHAGKAMLSTVKGAMSRWGDKLIDEFGAAGLEDYVASAGVGQWRSTVIKALKMEGQYSAANVKRTLYQMSTESGGNPRAINLWDSNAKKGTPSKGLLQVIDPTFRAYARPGYNKNSYDPLSNILASVRYATSRYGSLANAYKGHGYANGTGTVDIPQYTPSSSFASASRVENNNYSPSFSITINGAEDSRKLERDVKRWIRESMDEMFDSMARKSPRLVEC